MENNSENCSTMCVVYGLKKLFDYECHLRLIEQKTIKATHEYNKKLSILKATRETQRRELLRFVARAEKLERKNAKLREVNKKSQVMQYSQPLVQLQQESLIKLPQQIQEKERFLQEVNELYCFQNHTKIFFNLKKLPKLIQGLTVSEQESTCQLLPFKIDPQQHTHEEVTKFLWEQQYKSGLYKEHWEYLVFGDCANNNKSDTKVET